MGKALIGVYSLLSFMNFVNNVILIYGLEYCIGVL